MRTSPHSLYEAVGEHLARSLSLSLSRSLSLSLSLSLSIFGFIFISISRSLSLSLSLREGICFLSILKALLCSEFVFLAWLWMPRELLVLTAIQSRS